MATNGVLVARPIVPDMPHLVAHLALERFPHIAASYREHDDGKCLGSHSWSSYKSPPGAPSVVAWAIDPV